MIHFPSCPERSYGVRTTRANSSVVERLSYKQVVGGSNPSSPIAAFAVNDRREGAVRGGVAQLVRALPCQGRGRGFEPRHLRMVEVDED